MTEPCPFSDTWYPNNLNEQGLSVTVQDWLPPSSLGRRPLRRPFARATAIPSVARPVARPVAELFPNVDAMMAAGIAAIKKTIEKA